MKPPSSHATDREEQVWKALADPTRREILDLLREEARTTGDLAARFSMSRYGVMKHLKVLEGAELVLVRRQGRERWNHLNPVPVQEIYRRWIRPFEAPGADGLLRLRELAESPNPGPSPPRSKESPMNEQPFRSLDIQLEVAIAASPEKVWRALTEEIGAWWPKHFYISENPEGFVLEKKVGGRVYEDWGSGHGLLWGTIVVLEEGKKLQWAGDLAAEFGGPARTLTSYAVQAQGEGTLLQFRDTPYGHLSPSTGASLTEGWQDLLENCFKAYVEKGQQRLKLRGVD